MQVDTAKQLDALKAFYFILIPCFFFIFSYQLWHMSINNQQSTCQAFTFGPSGTRGGV